MTLSSQINSFKTQRGIINTAANKLTAMNAIALMVFVLLFLTSTLVHADHITEAINVEQQECHICHQGIDTPPELPHVQAFFGASYNANIYDVVTAQFKVDDFLQPQLRAPPVVP